MPTERRVPNRTLQMIGWLLFIASAICFTGSTWLSGDWLGLSGSLLFLVACFVFLWPLVRR
jgi:F0F1-type ATP synthase assembly protein I